jgi:hypothetical protein
MLAMACSEYTVVSGSVVDSWTQADTTVISDVLFVIDDSPSMLEEQGQLQANYVGFLDAVQSTDVDFRIGVVTTDVESDEAGMLRGGYLHRESINLDQALIDALDVGASGNRSEQGLNAAVMATDGRNDGFPRANSMFTIVFVSDEDDESLGDVQSFVDVLMLASSESVSIHGIVGDLPHGCATGTSAAVAGPRYLEAVTLTGGYRESICAADYSVLLERVGLDAVGLPDTFELSSPPHNDTLHVEVDGVLMIERDIDGWTYEPGNNAVVMHGRAIPRSGMEIVVRYTPLTGASANTGG